MFFWNSLAFSMIQWMLATWSLVPLPFLKPAWTSGVHGSRTTPQRIFIILLQIHHLYSNISRTWASLVAQTVKNLPIMQETWVRSLGQEDRTEKGMAIHSNILAWRVPRTEEPNDLQSMGSLRVGHDWETSLLLFTFMRWRRKWQPTPVFLPGESQGPGSLVGCHLWGRTELDTTEAT